MTSKATTDFSARKRLIVAAIAACFASAPAWSNPTGPQVANGGATFNQSGKLLTVTNSNGAIINWNSFSIGAGETTRFNQANAASSVLNRVIANDPSVLLGTLSSNGKVWLVNPAGIMVGQGARIDVGGFIASTLNVRNEDFLAGRLNFGATPNAGKVENYGQINTPSGGSVYLIAPEVENHGIINAPNGEVILVAGQTAQLIDTGTPGVKVDITGAEGNVTNLGEIVAEAGRIGMAGVLVKNSGTLNASSLVREGGRIFLKASQDAYVDQAGRIVTTGTKGGRIEVLGNRVAVMDNASLDASGRNGGGQVLVGGDAHGANPDIQNAQVTYFGPSAQIKADATQQGNGGKVFVWADDTTRMHGNVSARGGAEGGDGGFVETSGGYLEVTGTVNTLAPKGTAGNWLLDPQFLTVAISGGSAYADGTNNLFGNNSGGTTVITPASINGSSTNVTLQASTDVTFTDPVSMSFSGASLTAQAGRSILVNNDITTNNGNVSLEANYQSATGARTAGAGGITMADGKTINAGGGMVLLHVGVGAGTGQQSGDIVAANITAQNVNFQQNGQTLGTSNILRASSASLITARNLLLEVDHLGVTANGSVGASGSPIRVAPYGGSVINLESHTHEASPGIFIEAPNSGTSLVIGDVPFFTGGVNGVQTVISGPIEIKATGVGSSITTNAGTGACGFGAFGLSGGPICAGGAGDTIKLIADGSIAINGIIAAQGGDVTVNSNLAGYGGGIYLGAGSSINSNGGNIIMGGGTNPASGYAVGNGSTTGGHTVYGGITVLGDITAGSGNVTMHGEGANSGSNHFADGIMFGGGLLSSNGTVIIDGKAHVRSETTTGTEVTAGVDFLGGGTRLSTQTGTVTVTGLNNAPAGFARAQGITVEAGTIIETTGTGTLTLNGTSTGYDTGWGVGIFGGTIQTTAAGGGAIAIHGTNIANPDGGVVLQDGHVLSSGGAINITGESTDSPVGFINWVPNTLMLGGPNSGAITITGLNTGSIHAIGDYAGVIDAGTANLTFSGAAIDLTNMTLQGSGNLILQPVNPAATIGVAGGSGAFNLGTTGLGFIQPGFSSITIGRSDGTGAIEVGAHSWSDSVIFRNPGAGADGITQSGATSLAAGKYLKLLSGGPIDINNSITGAAAGSEFTTPGSLTVNGTVGAQSIVVNADRFTLSGGTWNQVSATLPALTVNDFRITGGTFIRALGGDGIDTPYHLADIYGVQGMGSAGMLGKSYVLANNIDATGTANWNAGAGFAPVGDSSSNSFTGQFDGLNHTITNLTVTRYGTDYVGLFGYIGYGGVVSNVGLADGNVIGNAFVGGLAGYNEGSISGAYATGIVRSGSYNAGGLVGYNAGSISNAYATGNVDGCYDGCRDNIGGLVGYNSGLIEYAHATGSVTGDNYVGGLVGYNDYGGTVSNSHATGGVTGYSSNVGGLVGYNDGSISNAYATGNVDGSYDGGINNIGGLVGYNTGSIDNAYATGTVSGRDNVGGLVGYNDYGTVSNSYATGSVTGNDYVGGLVGYNQNDCSSCSSITNAYASGSVAGSSYVGGLVGYNDSAEVSDSYSTGFVTGTGSAGGLIGYNLNSNVNNSFWDTETSGQTSSDGGTGMTTADMMQSVNFTSATTANYPDNPSWSTSTWGFINGVAYPYLQWRFPIAPQIVSGTLIGDTGGSVIQTAQNGNLLTTSSTGANGFYYQALDPGSVGNGSALLAYFANSGGNPAAAVRLGDGGHLTGVDLLTNKLLISSSGVAAVSNGILSTTKGSLSSSDIPYSVSENDLTLVPGIEFQTTLGTRYTLDGNVTTTDAGITLGGSSTANASVTLSAHSLYSSIYGSSVTIGVDGAISSSASGTAITISSSGTFANNSAYGATALSAPNGRWLVYSADPASNTLGGLSAGFKRYNCTYVGGCLTAGTAIPGAGNGFLYSVAPVITVTPDVQAVTYGNAGYTSTLSGFIDGDTAAVASGTATLTVGGAISTSGRPIVGTHELTYASGLASTLGYQFQDAAGSTNELTVNARALSVGATGASKVYDGLASATLTYGDNRLVGDVLTLTGSANFSDKNVGVAKLVTASGISLTGADAGNYMLTSSTATAMADITVRPLNMPSIWTGGGDGINWSDAANWAAQVIPDLSNVLTVSVPTGKSVTYDAAAGTTNLASLTAAGLNIAGGTLNIANNLTVSSNFNQTGGTLGDFAGGSSASITQTSGNLNLPKITVANLTLNAPVGAITQSGRLAALTLNTQSQGATTLTDPNNQVTNRVDMTAGGPLSLWASGDLNLGAINAGANPVVIKAGGAILKAPGTETSTNIIAGAADLTSTFGGKSGDLAISTDTQITGALTASVGAGADFGGIRIKNTGTQPVSVTLTDNALAGESVSFLNTGNITSTSGFTLKTLKGGDLSLLSNGNLTWDGGSLVTPSGSVLVSADGTIGVTGALSSPVDLALSSKLVINVTGSVSTSGTGTASFTAPSVAINGSVNTADDVGIIADAINFGAGSSTGAGHDVILAAANVTATNATVTAGHDISAAVTGDLHLNGSGFTAGNDIFIKMMGPNSTLYLNDTTGPPRSFLWAQAPATIHLDYPARLAAGMVVDGVAVEPLKFASAAGGSGLFYSALMAPATPGAGLEVTYANGTGILGGTTVAPTVFDAVIAAITASTTTVTRSTGTLPVGIFGPNLGPTGLGGTSDSGGIGGTEGTFGGPSEGKKDDDDKNKTDKETGLKKQEDKAIVKKLATCS